MTSPAIVSDISTAFQNSREYKRIVLVYPKFPVTHWGMQYYMSAIGKKSSFPPLGLITIAALTPDNYQFRLVDLNIRELTNDDIEWADMVCFSGMLIQKKSMLETALRVQKMKKPVVFGGPYVTACPDECAAYCDVMVLNEGEVTWPLFLQDLNEGIVRKVYRSSEKPDMTQSPTPRYDLLSVDDYLCMAAQFSRGCPFMCEFCDIIVMFGRRPRVKTPEQFLKELDAIYQTGYRGLIYLVNDNFIGNKKEVRRLLPYLKEWNEKKQNPFYFSAEASINLAEEEDLIQAMVDANFVWVFIGLESPSEDSLREAKKLQNIGKSLVSRVQTIQNAGLIVFGGFIIGFDSDRKDIFEKQIRFIDEASISNAAVGLLYALPGTPLHDRMKRENRLNVIEGQHTQNNDKMVANYFYSEDVSYTNIKTIIPHHELLEGYFDVKKTIYDPANYFRRTLKALHRLPAPRSFLKAVKKMNQTNRLIGKNFSMKRKGNWVTNLVYKYHRLYHIYQEYSKLPGRFKKEANRFCWNVLTQCPHLLAWVIPHIFMGAHFYRFVYEHELPSRKAIKNFEYQQEGSKSAELIF